MSHVPLLFLDDTSLHEGVRPDKAESKLAGGPCAHILPLILPLPSLLDSKGGFWVLLAALPLGLSMRHAPYKALDEMLVTRRLREVEGLV